VRGDLSEEDLIQVKESEELIAAHAEEGRK
jgi:hypothetical protein